MFPTEEHSLEAINQLKDKFPYAAALLIYAVLERCLKLHLLESRKTLTDAEVNLEHKVNGRKLSEAGSLDDDAFVREFLARCTLGTLEVIYRVPDNKYSTARNEVFHSDLFLRNQRRSDYTSRHEENRDYLETARAHLVEASKLYFRQEISESDGSLQFER